MLDFGFKIRVLLNVKKLINLYVFCKYLVGISCLEYHLKGAFVKYLQGLDEENRETQQN